MADRPTDIPLSGWLDIAVRVYRELGRDRVSLVAAGVGFFGLLAAFPALAAFVSIYGLFASPDEIGGHLANLRGLLPEAVFEFLTTQLTLLANRSTDSLGLAAAIGLLTSLWSAGKGTVATIDATNLAYEEQDKRSFFSKLALSMLFTVAAITYFAVVVIFTVIIPVVLHAYGESVLLTIFVAIAQYAVVWGFVVVGLSWLYRYAPHRRRPRWRWVTCGAVIAATLWMIGSALLALYVSGAVNYQKTYGSLAGVVVTMLWLYLTGFVVILGAQINAEIEHQTKKDSTVGPDRPMGARGAYVADNLGRARDEDQ